MSAASHWKKALPYYVQASLRFSLMFWVLPLAAVLIGSIWIGITRHHLLVHRVGLGLSMTFGGGFFLLALLTSVAADVLPQSRSWGRHLEPRSSLEGFFVSWRSFLFGLSLSRLSPGSVAQRSFCLLLHRVGHHCDTLLPNGLKRTNARLVRNPSTRRLVEHFGGKLVSQDSTLSPCCLGLGLDCGHDTELLQQTQAVPL